MHLLGILIKQIVNVDGEPHHAYGIAAISSGNIYEFHAHFAFLPTEDAVIVLPPSQPGAYYPNSELMAEHVHDEIGYPDIYERERASLLRFLRKRAHACAAVKKASRHPPPPQPGRPTLRIGRITRDHRVPIAAEGTALFHDDHHCEFHASLVHYDIDNPITLTFCDDPAPDPAAAARRTQEIADTLGFTDINRQDRQAIEQFRLERIDACREFMRDPADWPWPLTSAWSET